MSWQLSEPRSTPSLQPAARASDNVLGARFKRLFSVPGFSRWTIAARITAIVLTLAVPLNVVILAVVWHLSEAASDTQRTGLVYTARSVAAAVDAKLGEYMALAQALARSPTLLENNLEDFEAEARRAFVTPDAWVLVADAEGRQLFNMERQPGQTLPIRDPIPLAAQKRAFETRAAIIADVRDGSLSQEWIVNIEVPVFKNGQPFRALAVAVKAQAFLQLLNDQQIPKNWLACIIDHQGRFVARVPGHEGNVGQRAAEGFQKIKDQDGVFEFASVEGDPIVSANTHSATSGWPVAIAVKKTEMQAAAWSTIRWAAILGGTLSFLSLLFAGAMSRRITGPIAGLRQKAGALLSDPASVMPPNGPPEVSDLWEAMKSSVAGRHHSDQALRESEERFRGIFEHAGTGIAILNLEGRYQSCNPAYSRMLGYSEDELRELTFPALVHPEDLETNMAENMRLLAQEIPSFEIFNRYLRRDGTPIWVHKYVSLLRDAAGRPNSIISLVTDMTEHKRHEERIRLLLREVNHRSKNMLALVQAVARQTLAAKPQDFIGLFVERIQALAASQDLLVKNEWQGVDLGELAKSQLAHFKDLIGSRIELTGPPILISASAAQTIGMALHELATNAGKYGALVNGNGHVNIEWGFERAGAGEEIFVMSWREWGGPLVTVPAHSGFGSTVVCALAEMSLDGKVDLDFAVTGLNWRLQCRAEALMDGSRSAPAPASTNRDNTLARSGTRSRILVVEDEPLVAIEIAHVLNEAGFDVVGSAGSVPVAIELLKRTGCDAAVLDINLGSETSELVALALEAHGIPFVTVSGYSREQHPPVFKSAPGLTKPLRPELLTAELRCCIEQGVRRASA